MIPKIIHQTYKTDDPKSFPPVYAKGQQLIRKFHPDWEYTFWTDATMETEMQENFQEYYAAWSKLPRMIMKIDVFRYCLMLKYGGLYADLDYHFRRPFDLRQHSIVLPLSRDKMNGKYPNRLGNCVFASTAGHPFWKYVLEDILTRQERFTLQKDEDVDDGENGTGPGFITRMVHEYPEALRQEFHFPGKRLFHPRMDSKEALLQQYTSYGKHVCAGVWREGAL